MSESAPEAHRSYAPIAVGVSVVTVSDSRTAETDTSGDLIASRVLGAGHKVMDRAIVPDDPCRIRECVLRSIARADIDAVVLTGGTGVSPRDSTIECIEPLLQKVLVGFGELFRALSYQEVGAAAMLSRAVAGTAERTAIFAIPGSSGAVRLALDSLILPELPHLIGQLRR
jgi:molybdenum cofactor biosynthesis protein B